MVPSSFGTKYEKEKEIVKEAQCAIWQQKKNFKRQYERHMQLSTCLFWLNIQQLSNFGEVDKQIIVDANLYRISKGIIAGIF